MAHEPGNKQMSARQSMGPIIGRSMMKQPTFNWDIEDKCNKLKNVKLEVNNICKSYNMPDVGNKTIVYKNWLSRKGLQL